MVGWFQGQQGSNPPSQDHSSGSDSQELLVYALGFTRIATLHYDGGQCSFRRRRAPGQRCVGVGINRKRQVWMCSVLYSSPSASLLDIHSSVVLQSQVISLLIASPSISTHFRHTFINRSILCQLASRTSAIVSNIERDMASTHFEKWQCHECASPSAVHSKSITACTNVRNGRTCDHQPCSLCLKDEKIPSVYQPSSSRPEQTRRLPRSNTSPSWTAFDGERPLHRRRHQLSVRPDTRGYWKCCGCGHTNNPALAPERCPTCGHHKKGSRNCTCHVY
jgi:hypothetical protein